MTKQIRGDVFQKLSDKVIACINGHNERMQREVEKIKELEPLFGWTVYPTGLLFVRTSLSIPVTEGNGSRLPETEQQGSGCHAEDASGKAKTYDDSAAAGGAASTTRSILVAEGNVSCLPGAEQQRGPSDCPHDDEGGNTDTCRQQTAGDGIDSTARPVLVVDGNMSCLPGTEQQNDVCQDDAAAGYYLTSREEGVALTTCESSDV